MRTILRQAEASWVLPLFAAQPMVLSHFRNLRGTERSSRHRHPGSPVSAWTVPLLAVLSGRFSSFAFMRSATSFLFAFAKAPAITARRRFAFGWTRS